MATDEKIGQRLRRLRRERGLSQHDAAGPGLTTAYISRIENGERRPSIKAIRQIAERLGVSPEYLETGSPVAPADKRRALLDEAELELRLAENPAAAEARFRAVLAEAREAADSEAVARAQAGVGLAAAHMGRPRDAIVALEQVIDTAGVTPSTHPAVYATLAQCYAIAHETSRAVELLEQCLDDVAAREPENSTTYVRYATYLSYALTDSGDHMRAKAVIEQGIAHADQARDPYTRIRLYWSQARLAAADGDYGHAQAALRRAVALLEVVDDSLHLARAHRLWAEVLIDGGDADAAREHLEQATGLFGPALDSTDDALLQLERARIDLLEGDARRAVEGARGALAISVDEATIHARAEWILGEAYSILRDERAANHFARASELIPPRSRHRKRFLTSWTDYLQREGRVEEAATVLKEVVLRDL